MSSRPVVVVVVAVFAILGWMGLGVVGAPHSGSAPAASSTVEQVSAGRVGSSATATSGTVAVGPTSGSAPSESALDSQAVAATRAAGLKANVVYLPRGSATPAQLATLHETGVVSSFYTTDPAPMGLAYYGTSRNGELYVPNFYSDTVSVISGTANTVVATIPVGIHPNWVMYDAGNGDVYVPNSGSSNVSVISAATDTVVATIPVGNTPNGATYDSATGAVYVPNSLSNNVSVINGATNAVVATVPAGTHPAGAAYDAANGEVYVANYDSKNVTAINGATDAVVASIGVGDSPYGLAYDPANGHVYVANCRSNNVSVIDGVKNAVVSGVAAGTCPATAAYDPGNGEVYVANYDSNDLTAINGTTNTVVATVPVGIGPFGPGYDSENGDVYVANNGSNNVSVIDGATNHVAGTVPVGDAPAGVAYDSQALTPSILNTTSLLGIVEPNATGIRGADLYQSIPDAYSIQLNAVLTNVTLFGTPGFSFWAQAVATFYPATGEMILVSNVWNFSAVGARMTSDSIFEHGANGNPSWGTLGYYFSNESVAYRVSYPFTLELSLTSTLADGRNSVNFGAFLSSPTDAFPVTNGTFDYVTFNSYPTCFPGCIVLHAASTSNFTANGMHLNPAGLPDDFELDIVGPGAGSQVDLATADATLGLAYYTGHDFETVPSAYSYGGDTAETSTGANIAWTNGTFGPFVSSIYYHGTMTTGPSILTGLWGLGAPSDSLEVTIDVTPANAFDFFSYLGTADFTSSFSSQFEYAPDMTTNTFYLMSGEYNVVVQLADHDPESFTLYLDSSINVLLDLNPDVGIGIATPLWAFNNAEVAAISQSGSGTATNPYILDHNQNGPLPSMFGLYNDRGFPVFPGLFLKGTNASVEVNDSFDFLADTSDAQGPGDNLSQTNNLQMWFWNVTNVDLNDSNISGWFAGLAYYPLAFNTFNVVFYESQHNLVSDNYFLTQGQGLLMYSSGQFFGPEEMVGGNNTIWGNDFVQVTPPVGCPDAPCFAYLPYSLGLGAEIGEDFDLIYNNQFDTPTTSWLLPLDLYTQASTTYEGDSWNITTQAASATYHVPNFPTIPLYGSVVGGSTQGGNSWWDYGVTTNWANGADNPLGVLPYDENASTLLDPATGYGQPLSGYTCGSTPPAYYCATYIHPDGDFAPLQTVAAAVDVEPEGAIPGVWGATFSCSPPVSLGGGPPITLGGGGGTSLAGTVCCPAPPVTPGGGPPITLGGGGGPSACDPPARILADILTNASSFDLVLPAGEYNVTPYAPPGYTSVAPFTLNVTAGPTIPVPIPYLRKNWNVTFSESGLPSGLTWQVTVAGTPLSLLTNGGTDSLTFAEPNGIYGYAITDISGWHQPTLPYTGTVTVNGAALTEPTLSYAQVTYAVTFTESGLPTGDLWYVNITDGPTLYGTGATTSLTTNLPNGTYLFTVATNDQHYEPSSFVSNPCVVSGGSVTESGSFVLVTYAVTFTESGLPSGTSWNVTLGTSTQSSTGSTITFPEPNATYSFTVGSVSGYVTNPSSGAVTVQGTAVNQAVQFTIPAISVSPGRGPVGAMVTVSGTGFSDSTSLRSLVFDAVTISSCASGSLAVGASGAFSCTFRVPSGTSGTTVTATNAGGQTATAAFTVTSLKVAVSPGLGPPGAKVTVSGTGFSGLSTVGLVFDGVTISSCTNGSLTTGATGSFSCTFKVPGGTSGTTVTATDIGGQKATATFFVTTPVIAVLPGQGPPGGIVVVAGAGFSVSSPVGLVFDGVTISSCTDGSLTTTSLGLFACVFKVPIGTSGTTVTATDVGGVRATAPFTVTIPKITLSATQGAPGATVTVSGTGFSVLSTVRLVFDGVTISSCTSGSLRTSATGTFSCTFKVPSHTSGTTVAATDVAGQVATAKFTVT
jgi:YVTN family beta-propeller protein